MKTTYTNATVTIHTNVTEQQERTEEVIDYDEYVIDSDTKKRYGLEEYSEKHFLNNVELVAKYGDYKNYIDGVSVEEAYKKALFFKGRETRAIKLANDAREILRIKYLEDEAKLMRRKERLKTEKEQAKEAEFKKKYEEHITNHYHTTNTTNYNTVNNLQIDYNELARELKKLAMPKKQKEELFVINSKQTLLV
jgi:hypothetical protein